tara:strand:+ start:1937 stop:2062 length:126 start_codon:yes stop_codon:yes gene_type:complete
MILKDKKYYYGFTLRPVHLAERSKVKDSGMSSKISKIKTQS